MEETTEKNQETVAADANANDAAGRLRDEKGHFLPNPDKKPKRTRKPKDDANTVKIRIVKDEVPPPEKDFTGRLDDIKERTATNFLRAVCYHKPKEVNIDGLRYYSQDYVKGLQRELADERECSNIISIAFSKEIELNEEAQKEADNSIKQQKKLQAALFVWKSIANVSLAVLLTVGVILGSKKFWSGNSVPPTQNEQIQATE